MSVRATTAMALVLAVALPAHAEPLLVTDTWMATDTIVTVDSETLEVTAVVPFVFGGGEDVAFGPDGLMYSGARRGIARTLLDGTLVDWWLDAPDALDLDFLPNGNLLVLDKAYPVTPESAVSERAASDGSEAWRDSIPGFDITGSTVPRAGPYEGGILAIAFETATGDFYLFRWRPDAVERFVREGPFGPLAVRPHPACFGALAGDCVIHPTVAGDGLSFFTVEPAISRIQQHDLEGRLVRTVAEIAPDTALVRSGVPGDRFDLATNMVALDDGTVFVTTARRLYRFDAAGAMIGRAEYPFRAATAVTPARWQPFESAGIPCRPWSVGFWKRQCASQGLRRQPLRRGRAGVAVPAPPIHPAFQDGRLPGVIERASAWLAPHGVTACEALQPDSPNTWREKALRRYAAIALNVEDRRIGRRCPVVVEGATAETGAVLDEIRGLLSSIDDDDLKRAFQLAGAILGEE